MARWRRSAAFYDPAFAEGRTRRLCEELAPKLLGEPRLGHRNALNRTADGLTPQGASLRQIGDRHGAVGPRRPGRSRTVARHDDRAAPKGTSIEGRSTGRYAQEKRPSAMARPRAKIHCRKAIDDLQVKVGLDVRRGHRAVWKAVRSAIPYRHGPSSSADANDTVGAQPRPGSSFSATRSARLRARTALRDLLRGEDLAIRRGCDRPADPRRDHRRRGYTACVH